MSINSGAHWLKCDLHVHTPFDKTKKFGEDAKAAEEAFRKGDNSRIKTMAFKFFEACRGAQLDIAVITDHNTIKGYSYFAPFLEEWILTTGYNLILLPGLEMTVGGERNLHTLILVEKNTDVDTIDRFITAVFDGKKPFGDNGSPISCGKDLRTFLSFSRGFFDDEKVSYLLIPAHVNRSSGIEAETRYDTPNTWEAELKGALRERVFAQRMWAGFQVRGAVSGIPNFMKLMWLWASAFYYNQAFDDLSPIEQQRIKSRTHWPMIEASDPEKYENIGSTFTWLKMSIPDIEGIRLALIDPESRLRCFGTSKPAQNCARINRLKIRNTDFIDEVDIPFNPELNTIIGGRGCGKSALIELIRFTLDRARSEDFEEDEEEIKQYVTDILREKSTRDHGNTNGMLINNYQVEIDVVVAGRQYKVVRSNQGIEIQTEDGSVDSTLLDIRTLISPRIFSQRQIGRIAKDPIAQRRELDALIGVDYSRQFKDQQRNLVGQIKDLQSRRDKIRQEIATLPERETELRKVKDQIGFLESSTNAQIVETYKHYKEEEKWLDLTQQNIEGMLRHTADVNNYFGQVGTNFSVPVIGPTEDWLNHIRGKLKNTVDEATYMLKELETKLVALNNEITSGKSSIWHSKFVVVDETYRSLSKSMEEQGVAFHQHPILLEKQKRLEEEINHLRELTSSLKGINQRIKELREKLVDLYKDRYNRRVGYTQNLEGQNTDVRLEIKPFGEIKSLMEKREEWFGGSGFQNDDWKILVNYVFSVDEGFEVPSRLWRLVNSLREDIENTWKQGRSLSQNESRVYAILGTGANQLSGRFLRALEKGDRIQIDDIELFIPDDLVSSSVRDTQGNWKPIEQGSIGLKSTAVISLLLSSGDQPLIIDQPEDELDNKYIYDVIVNLLRKRKFSRQIIIATHNANIPVNGDAEMIIALGVENRLGKVEAHGSIDHKEVKRVVSEVMEGSAEAFRLRRERYGY